MSALHRIALPFHRVIVVLLLMFVLGIVVLAKTSNAQAASISGNSNHGIPATLCPGSPMQTRFTNQWESIMRSASGTVNPNGYLKVIGSDLIPYHSIETFMVEAPDHGHELSSETLSYLLWFAAQYANITGDFSYYNNAWNVIEKYSIPNAQNQPNGGYNASSPSTYAGEYSLPSLYPAALNSGVPVGQDPFYSELSAAYGNNQIYGMHWIFDGDNFYGFGNRNDGTSQMAYMNTFQRGPQESTWETIPQPSWDTMKWGAKVNGAYQGFGPFFIGGAGAAKYSYTNAPDADARAVQAALLAQEAAVKWGVNISAQNARAAKMGDYLRYAMAEKSFKAIPCASMSGSCPGGTGKNSLHYLMSWYYAWGGDASAGSWSWRIGDYAAHFGYQNPIAALALGTDANFRPLSATGAADWNTSFKRQLDFYQWLQSAEGAIAGGAEFGQVSSSGSYTAAPAGTPAFNGLTYVENPVYLDPGSNTWFGFQAWSMQRITELYYRTNNAQAAAIATKWANWLKTGNVFRFIPGTNGEDVEVASTIDWDGAPAGNWTTNGTSNPPANPGLHVSIVNYGQDMGTMSSAINALTWYAAATQRWGTLDTAARDLAKRVLDAQWNNHRTAKGVAGPEARADYKRFHDPVYVPAGMSGTTPRCAGVDCIVPGATFKSIRPAYQQDVDYNRVEAAIAAGTAPVFTFHRFWAQVDVAMANSFWGQFFETCGPTPTPGGATSTPTRTNTPGGPTTVPPTRTNTPAIPTNTGVPPTTVPPTTVPPTQPPSSLKLQYKAADTAASDNQVKPHFNIVNTGSSAVALSELKIRYFFTRDNSAGLSFNCDWSQVGCGNITAAFPALSPATADADTYLELSFSAGAGSVAAGGQSGDIQARLNHSDWTNFNESNDYSFDPTKINFADHTKVALYRNGTLVWGTVPGGTTPPTAVPPTNTNVPPTTIPPTATRTNTRTNTPVGPTATRTNTRVGPTATRTRTNTPVPPTTVPPTRTNTPVPPTNVPPTTVPPTQPPTGGLQVSIRSGGTDNNQQTQFAYVVRNTGTSAASNVSVRVYFTLDGTNAASNYVLEKYYDQSGVATFSSPTLASGTTYYIQVNYGTASLAAGAQWELQTSLHLGNWGTNFNSGNDHFHTGFAVGALPAALTATNYLPAYISGTLAWGVEPGGSIPPTTAPTRTNTPVGPTPIPPTRTNTPTGPTSVPPTATRTNTPGGPTPIPPTPGARLDNPFVGANIYVNPDWSAAVLASASRNPSLASKMNAVANMPTFVWMDTIDAVNGTNGYARSLVGHLDAALAQGRNAIQIVVYNLPGRDCAALASNGELPLTQAGFDRYKTEYIDAIYNAISQAKYAGLRIIAVIEVDSLPNLVTNLGDPECAQANSQPYGYRPATQYALNKLAALNNFYAYIDIGHHGWLGWSSNFGPAVTLIGDTIKGTTKGVNSIAGFVSASANYVAVDELYHTATQSIGGQPARSAKWHDWNDYIDERTYDIAWRNAMIAAGFPSSIGMLIDTARNGWGGAARPTGPSTSTDLNTFVNESRIDRRIHKGNWCNQAGAGIGIRPTVAPAAGFDAFVWVKPPGESDGSSTLIPQGPDNPAGKGLDRMCDPTYGGNSLNGNSMSGALPNAPVSGRWFEAQFVELVTNAYPPLP